MDGWMDGGREGGMDGWKDGWMAGWLDSWMAGWLDGWLAGWLDGWMDGNTHSVYNCISGKEVGLGLSKVRVTWFPLLD